MILSSLHRLRPILGGMKQFVCGYSSAGESVGANSNPRYCYSVWLRHLTAWRRQGIRQPLHTVAELGPGDSLGTGIAALLSGVDQYYALDAVAYSNTPLNLVDEISALYRNSSDIPGEDEFPELKPRLDSYGFPHDVLPAAELKASLESERVERIRRAALNIGTRQEQITIQYRAPWDDASIIQAGSVDAAFSQAVMEHVNDINATYRALYSWLAPGGCMSHQVDFRSHGLAVEWNGHWSYSDWLYKVARGKRPYLLNRQTKSDHLNAIHASGFDILYQAPVLGGPGIPRSALAPGFRGMSDDDLATSGLFVIARKPSAGGPVSSNSAA